MAIDDLRTTAPQNVWNALEAYSVCVSERHGLFEQQAPSGYVARRNESVVLLALPGQRAVVSPTALRIRALSVRSVRD